MTKFIQTQNGNVVRAVNEYDVVEWDAENYCTPAALERDGKSAQFGVFRLAESATPTFDPITQSVSELPPTEVDGVWTQQWAVVDLDAETVTANQTKAAAATLASFDSALTSHLDKTAQARRYDNRITCALRAGYAGPFQTEGQAFAAWMDACNWQAYQILAGVQSGALTMPTVAEFIADLPAMVWPE